MIVYNNLIVNSVNTKPIFLYRTHSFSFDGIPSNRLIINIGAPLILLDDINLKDGRRNETWLKFQEIRFQTKKLVIAGLNRDENVVFLPHITFTLNESEAFPGLEVTSISHHDGICNDCKRKNKSVTGSLRFSNTENLAKNQKKISSVIE